jgi:hypothetical protein
VTRARGQVAVTERDQATVPGVVIDNRGRVHVLLLAGEILLGGKQNRIVAEDVLVPPLSGPLMLPVYCVEQGRWAGSAQAFTTRDSFAAPGLRARMLARSDQRDVWAEVDRYAEQAAALSPTGSYQAIHDQGEVQAIRRTSRARSARASRPGLKARRSSPPARWSGSLSSRIPHCSRASRPSSYAPRRSRSTADVSKTRPTSPVSAPS